tara:strand:+ start:88214 stop:88549 length:336 start_codon:yes stop_codon:yes gene_type:complete
MNWLFAIIATIFCYVLFSYFGLRTGAAESFRGAVLAPFTNIIDFLLIIFGSCGFGVATYYALKSSAFAIPMIISIGLIVSFVFSVLFADGRITVGKIFGLTMILAGILLVK